MKRTLLIDADILAYQASACTEEVHYFNGADEEPAVEADLEAAIASADRRVSEIRESLGATDVVICLTDRSQPTFRADIWPAYKANRKGRKPENLYKVIDHFAASYKTYLRPRLEADDCMGILSTHPTLVPGEKIIVSEDKDMQSIPGLLFNPRKDTEPRKITRLAADRYHMVQTITGDATDNYPGAVGIGPSSPEVEGVMAAKTVEEMWQHALAAYQRSLDREAGKMMGLKGKVLKAAIESGQVKVARGQVVHEATIQARCARILRASDWSFKEKRPTLWVPPVV
jgi:DNA polymerase-1